MADSPKSIARRKWGRFLPHQRANVDQVPLPFVNDMEVTCAVAVSNKQWRAEVAAHDTARLLSVSARVARFLNSQRESSRRVFLTLQFLNAPV